MSNNRRRRTLRRRVQLQDRRRCDVRTWFDYDADEWVVTIHANDEHLTEVRAPTLAEASSSAAEVLEHHERYHD